MKVVGYSDKLSVEPGGEITFLVSTESRTFGARLVRLIHGDTNASGPGFKAEPVASSADGSHPGRHQALRPGSYVRVPGIDGLVPQGDFTLQTWFWSTTAAKSTQTLLAHRAADGTGYALRIEGGRLTLRAGSQKLQLDHVVGDRTWYCAAAVHEAGSGRTRLVLSPVHGPTEPLVLDETRTVTGVLPGSVPLPATDFLIGAEWVADGDEVVAGNFYNGKIDSPKVFAGALGDGDLAALRDGSPEEELPAPLASWDFGRGISTWTVTDVSGNGHHGNAVNKPTRGVTGWNWTGSETAWGNAPHEYAAIHFHDDDLSDAGWEPSFTWTVPKDAKSGVYAFHLTADGAEDYLPFTIAPRLGAPRADVVLLLPVFSYLAYGNEQMLATGNAFEGGNPNYPWQEQDRYILANGLRSLYCRHTDGSGVCYSSWLRPVVNMRPKYHMSFLDSQKGSPHQFNADLHLIDWLEATGIAFDVITDVELHRDGAARLRDYQVVLTGTHAEYWSGEMIDASQQYLNEGGRLMNLSGNGMYWVTQLDPETGTGVEIRRRGPSQRTWDSEPGEAHLSSTGELGGTWRYRGRAAQKWLGVGTAAETGGRGRPYVRGEGSFDPRAAFVFEGIGADELIGDFPNLVNAWGASGFEIDRFDTRLGTPAHTILLASAKDFDDDMVLVSEDITLSVADRELIRSDMVLLGYPAGGAVFSVGSIAWSGCLSYHGYDNNVARVTRNVLDTFRKEADPLA
ncbi:LamG domain-containing protein [Streptomyces sp. NBC_00882]|uniref:N,N-dimethylformamidase beta subunit family domain-containing protein n=1 Tax=Streptomyces sp. NBC_00882 TaxID=2975856 RepID=UPI0038677405|nr:LamG domain-containing protein [Streptomyces sp. NBC_00882]